MIARCQINRVIFGGIVFHYHVRSTLFPDGFFTHSVQLGTIVS